MEEQQQEGKNPTNGEEDEHPSGGAKNSQRSCKGKAGHSVQAALKNLEETMLTS